MNPGALQLVETDTGCCASTMVNDADPSAATDDDTPATETSDVTANIAASDAGRRRFLIPHTAMLCIQSFDRHQSL